MWLWELFLKIKNAAIECGVCHESLTFHLNEYLSIEQETTLGLDDEAETGTQLW